MASKTASHAMVNSVIQSLFKAIGSEDGLPLECDLEALSKSHQIDDQDEISTYTLEAVDLLKRRLAQSTNAAFRYHNSLLPIKRLPSELLSTIISHDLADIQCLNYLQRLIRLSTVSSWWRSVTLENPSLWTVIHSSNPEWIVSLALERSKDSPLTIVHEEPTHTTTLSGRCSCYVSIGPEEFFGLVSPHTDRWGNTSLRRLGAGSSSTEWLNQHKIQFSPHLRQLNLCWHESPSTETLITRFSGVTECLLELTLQNLHVSSADIIRILSTSDRMTSLDLESLLVSEQENDVVPNNSLSSARPPTIDLSCLKNLRLKGLPPSLFSLVVEGVNTSNLEKVTISHRFATEENSAPSHDPFASFVARLLATLSSISVRPHSAGVTLAHFSKSACECDIELQGAASVVLPWLRLHSFPQFTQEYSVALVISSDELGDPEQVIIDNLMHFPKVGSVELKGSSESWRWAWLLSLPDAVKRTVGPERTTKSWLWPDLEHLNIHGDNVDEFTILSLLLARYGSRHTEKLISQKRAAPRQLAKLEVRPGGNEWRPEVVDRIRELLGPGCFQWKTT